MNPKQLKSKRLELGLSQAEFARMVGAASDRTVRRWEEAERDIPKSVIIILSIVDAIPAAKAFLLKLASNREK